MVHRPSIEVVPIQLLEVGRHGALLRGGPVPRQEALERRPDVLAALDQAGGAQGIGRAISLLLAEHAQALRDALARYVRAARRAGGAARRPARGGRKARAGGVDSTEVREWAKAQGIEVKDRGRVPAALVVKFKAATG